MLTSGCVRAALITLCVGVLTLSCSPSSSGALHTPSATATISPSPEPSPSPSPSPSPAPLQRMEAPLPAAVEETAAVSAGGRLYVLGGFDAAGRSLDSVYVYDGASWTGGPRLPLGLDHTAAAAIGDKVFVAGGHSGGADSARLFRLDGNTWTGLAPMHYARGGHSILALGGLLVVIGGNSAAGNVAAVETYDPNANAWAVVSSLPAPRNHVAGFVIGSRACVAGGRSPNTARVDCFAPDTGAWSRLADLPRPTSGAGAAGLPDGQVVVMGGEDAGESVMVDQFARFLDPGPWSTEDAMLLPRHGFQLVLFGDRAWACGGATAPGLHPVATCTSVI